MNTLARLSLAAIFCAGCSSSSVVTGGPFTGDPASATYDLDGKAVTLKNGMFEEKTGEGVDDVLATDLTQNRLDADFTGDDATDCAVVVTRDDGKLKVHYLAVIPNGATKAMTIALGKNVLVKNLELDPKGNIVVRMLGRDEGVPDDAPPTIIQAKSFAVKEGALVAK